MATFGITKVGATLARSVDLTHQAEVKQLIAADGTFETARNIDDSYSFSVSGFGDSPVEIGASSGGPTGVSGKQIITKVTLGQTNDGWSTFSYDGVAYPHVTGGG
jgi:hypothetical protein